MAATTTTAPYIGASDASASRTTSSFPFPLSGASATSLTSLPSLTWQPRTHSGPTTETNAYWRTTNAKKIRRGDYSSSFHTFGVQWTPRYIYFYVDSRVRQIQFTGFRPDRQLYDLGRFAQMAENQTLLANPWATSNSTTGNAPFDQKFYLILSVSVGSRNGWFL